jgi:DNA repair protein RecO (recombination protein O)
MRHENTTGIVLNRLNYGEADRIITVITPEYGKLRLMAKGVRKEKSKLAGGIELFTTTQISFIRGKRDISTLVSSRLITHFSNIAKDLKRTMQGYDLLKKIDKHTQDEVNEDYYQLLDQSLSALNNPDVSLELVKAWFIMRLLTVEGRAPNLATDTKGQKLEQNKKYQFDFEEMAFMQHDQGLFGSKHIKFLRLLGNKKPQNLNTIDGVDKLAEQVSKLLDTMLDYTS